MRLLRRWVNSACVFAALTVSVIHPRQRAFASASTLGSKNPGNPQINIIPLPKTYVNSSVAAAIDVKLMETPGFSIDQLMELAGLSVASAVHDYYTNKVSGRVGTGTGKRILLLCGPGNNGGDGLVAARHLHHFGYKPVIVYPKHGRANQELFTNLVKQCHDLNIEFINDVNDIKELVIQLKYGGDIGDNHRYNEYDVIVDALFGFSFSGQAREPYSSLINMMTETNIPCLSVDIPSGWHVNDGDIYNTGFIPDSLISLTIPKLCIQKSNYDYTGGVHYVGGRFVTPSVANAFDIDVPDYGNSTAQIALYASANIDENNNEICNNNNDNDNASAIRQATDVQTQTQTQTQAESDTGTSTGVSIVYITASDDNEATNIAKQLISLKLCACVNILPSIKSIYEWEGKIENSNEVLLMIKTKTILINDITVLVNNIHSYDIPEIISVPIINGSTKYINWIHDVTNINTVTTASESNSRSESEN
jgi:NAD(P)H-hydrate epimerase